MLKINVEITLTDDQSYTPLEANIVTALAGGAPAVAAASAAVAPKAAPAAKTPVTQGAAAPKAAPAKATPAAKAAPAKAATPKPPVKEEPAEDDVPMALEEPEAVAEEATEDAAEETLTVADAVAAATQLVAGGKQAKVKEALTAVGAKRVSEVKPAKVAAFLEALKA